MANPLKVLWIGKMSYSQTRGKHTCTKYSGIFFMDFYTFTASMKFTEI